MNLHKNTSGIDSGFILKELVFFKQLASKICYPYKPPTRRIRVKDNGDTEQQIGMPFDCMYLNGSMMLLYISFHYILTQGYTPFSSQRAEKLNGKSCTLFFPHGE